MINYAYATASYTVEHRKQKTVRGDDYQYDTTETLDVKEIKTKKFVGFLFWGTWKNVTTYTATIKTKATGVKVTKVQYQLNGGRWTTGTGVSSDKPIKTLKVKVWDNKGNVYEYTYPNN